LKIAVRQNIDEVIKLIKKSKDTPSAGRGGCASGSSCRRSSRPEILNMRAGRGSRPSSHKVGRRAEDVRKFIKECKRFSRRKPRRMKDPERGADGAWRHGFGDERRQRRSWPNQGEFSIEDLIAEEDW